MTKRTAPRVMPTIEPCERCSEARVTKRCIEVAVVGREVVFTLLPGAKDEVMEAAGAAACSDGVSRRSEVKGMNMAGGQASKFEC